MDYISKKDLLRETGISYGQLYRWKRQKLIPDEWFLKQSSYTGQETFFPKQQILSRVRAILEMKDNHTLEELARMLSPETAVSPLGAARLRRVSGVDDRVMDALERLRPAREYSFFEAVLIAAVCGAMRGEDAGSERVAKLIGKVLDGAAGVTDTQLLCTVFAAGKKYHAALCGSQPVFDSGVRVVKEVPLGEVAGRIKLFMQESMQETQE